MDVDPYGLGSRVKKTSKPLYGILPGRHVESEPVIPTFAGPRSGPGCGLNPRCPSLGPRSPPEESRVPLRQIPLILQKIYVLLTPQIFPETPHLLPLLFCVLLYVYSPPRTVFPGLFLHVNLTLTPRKNRVFPVPVARVYRPRGEHKTTEDSAPLCRCQRTQVLPSPPRSVGPIPPDPRTWGFNLLGCFDWGEWRRVGRFGGPVKVASQGWRPAGPPTLGASRAPPNPLLLFAVGHPPSGTRGRGAPLSRAQNAGGAEEEGGGPRDPEEGGGAGARRSAPPW